MKKYSVALLSAILALMAAPNVDAGKCKIGKCVQRIVIFRCKSRCTTVAPSCSAPTTTTAPEVETIPAPPAQTQVPEIIPAPPIGESGPPAPVDAPAAPAVQSSKPEDTRQAPQSKPEKVDEKKTDPFKLLNQPSPPPAPKLKEDEPKPLEFNLISGILGKRWNGFSLTR